jgi:hypothetical protein
LFAEFKMYLEAVLLKALEILGSLRISPQERSLPVIGCVPPKRLLQSCPQVLVNVGLFENGIFVDVIK